jgi:hypothetical protein
MKRIIYLCVCLIGFAGLFTSCINQVEPKGLQDLREGKAAYYQALASLQTANADKLEAEAAYEKAMAVADAAYTTAQANLLDAKAAYIKAEAAYLGAKQAALEEQTRHQTEMDKISEEVAKAEAEAAEAEAAYWKAYYADATSALAKQLELANAECQLRLDSIKMVQAEYAQKMEEDEVASAAAIANAKAEAETAAANNAAALANAKAALAESQKLQAEKEEALRQANLDIEAQKGLLTPGQQEKLSQLLNAYKSALDLYNETQWELLQAKSDLIYANQKLADAKATNAKATQDAIDNLNGQIAEDEDEMAELKAEAASFQNAVESNLMFQGIPIPQWLGVLDSLRVQDSVYRIAIANAMANATGSKYELMKDVLDYQKAYDDLMKGVSTATLTKDDYLKYPTYTSNGSKVYNDFNWEAKDSATIYNRIKDYLVDQTVVEAYKKTQDAVDDAQALVNADAAELEKLNGPKTTTGSIANQTALVASDKTAWDNAVAAEAAAKTALENAETDSTAQIAIYHKQFPDSCWTPMSSRGINMAQFFGYVDNITAGQYGSPNNGSVYVAKYMALMEDARVSGYAATTGNLRYPITYPNGWTGVACGAQGEHPYVAVNHGWSIDKENNPTGAVHNTFDNDLFQVITTPGRLHWVFFGGDSKSNPFKADGTRVGKDSTETVTRGIYGILDYIGQDGIYSNFKDNNKTNQIRLAEWKVVYALDSLKYATDTKAYEGTTGILAKDIAAIKAANEALKGQDALYTGTGNNPKNKADSVKYNPSLIGKAEAAKAAYDKAAAKLGVDTNAYNAAKAKYDQEVVDYNKWVNEGWDSLFTADFSTFATATKGSKIPAFLKQTYTSLGGKMVNVAIAGAAYSSPFFNAIKLYTGANDFYYNNGDPERLPGRSPKAWKEFYNWMRLQAKYATDSIGKVSNKYPSTTEQILHTSYPSIYLNADGHFDGTNYWLTYSKQATFAADTTAVGVFCTATAGEGYMLATADDNHMKNVLIPAYKKIMDSLAAVVAADKAALKTDTDNYIDAANAVNDGIDAYNAATTKYDGTAPLTTKMKFDTKDPKVPNNFDDVKAEVLAVAPYTTKKHADFATGYNKSVYEDGGATMPKGTDGYHFAFEGKAPYVAAPAEVKDVTAPYAYIAKVPDAEMYFICLNNQTGSTADIIDHDGKAITIGDVAMGTYGVATYTGVTYYDKVNSANIEYLYMQKAYAALATASRNRGTIALYPYLLTDNREHALQVQDYSPDFYTSHNSSDGWHAILHDQFQQAVYYKMIYDLQVVSQLDGDIAKFLENLKRFRAEVDKMYAAFQADSTASEEAWVKDQMAKKSWLKALKAAYATAQQNTVNAKAAYDAAVAKLGTPTDAAKKTGSLYAQLNYWKAQKATDQTALDAAENSNKPTKQAAMELTGKAWTMWKDLVKSHYDDANKAAEGRARLATLYTVYGNAFNLAESNGNSFFYPAWSEDGTETIVKRTDNIFDLYDLVNEYLAQGAINLLARVAEVASDIQDCEDQIAELQAAADEAAKYDALEGYYDFAKLRIANLAKVVADKENANGYAEACYNLAKSELNTYLTALGKEVVK